MTADPRAVEIIADALWRLDGIHVTPDGPDEYHRSNAEALLAKFTAAGWSLLPPGGREALADLLDEISDEWTSVLEIRRKAAALASHLTEGSTTA